MDVLLLIAALLAAGTGPECDQAREQARIAREALTDCLASGRSCDEELETLHDAETEAAPCTSDESATPTPPSPEVFRLAEPPLSGLLVGAVLRVTTVGGSICEGTVTAADSTHLVVGTRDISAAEIRTIRTLHPVGVPVHVRDHIAVDAEEGLHLDGRVAEVTSAGIVVVTNDMRQDLRWPAVLRIENYGHPPPDTQLGRLKRADNDYLPAETDGIIPVAIHRPQLIYPALAAGSGVGGVVVVEIMVEATGEVSDVRVVSGQPPFVKPAIEMAKQFLYEPVVVNGVATRWKSRLTIRFVPPAGSPTPAVSPAPAPEYKRHR